MVSGSFGAAAFVRAKPASTSPAMTLRPASSWPAGRLPSSIQRRTVSSLTPNSSAASRTRIDATAESYPQLRSNRSVHPANADSRLGELLLRVEARPLLAEPDRYVHIGGLGTQRTDVGRFARRAGERIPAEEPACV